MRRRTLTALNALLALGYLGALVAPAAILAGAADKGGVAGLHGYDLLGVSTALGLAHAAVVWSRLRRAEREAGLTNAVLAAFDGLLVVALMATGLLFVVLGALGPVGVVLVNEGLPMLALWTLVQAAAVLLGEGTRRAVTGWLERDPQQARDRSPGP